MEKLSLKTLRHQAGVTILEFIAFIGLAALVIAGALGLYSTANTSASSQSFVEGVSGIVTTLRQHASGNTNPDGITLAQISAPKGWTGGGTNTLTHTKSGATVACDDTCTTATNFTLTFGGAANAEQAKAARLAVVGKDFGGGIAATSVSSGAIRW